MRPLTQTLSNYIILLKNQMKKKLVNKFDEYSKTTMKHKAHVRDSFVKRGDIKVDI